MALNNKKADGMSFLLLVVWAVFLVYVLAVITYFTYGLVKSEIDIRDAEARVIANAILYSKNGISYSDIDLGITYPGTVDIDRIDPEMKVLSSSIYYPNNAIVAAKIYVTLSSGIILKSGTYNPEWYSRWAPLAGVKGSGGVSLIAEERYAAIYKGGMPYGYGKVRIEVLIPNA